MVAVRDDGKQPARSVAPPAHTDEQAPSSRGGEEFDSEILRERQLLLSITGIGLFVFIPATFLIALSGLGDSPWLSTVAMATYVAVSATSYVLAKNFLVALASHLVLTGALVLAIFGVMTFGGMAGPQGVSFPFVVLAALLLRGRRAAIGYGFVTSVFIWTVALAETSGLVAPRYGAGPHMGAFLVVLHVITASVVISMANRQRRGAQDEAERVAKIAKTNQRRLEQLIAESPDGLAWFDSTPRLMECNPEFSRLCNSSPARLIGKPIGQLGRFAAASRMEAVRAMELLGAGAGEQRFTLRSEGLPACIVEVRAKRVVLAGGQEAFQWIARDVTEREMAREARERLELELQAARRLEDIGRLAGGVAHDFNNLLTAVNANVHLLVRDSSLSPIARRQIDIVRQAGERAAALTQQLLAFARRQVLEPRPVELRGTVEGMAPLLQQLLGTAIVLELQLGAQDLWVEADRTRFEQVLTNLVVNARDAMPLGGRVVIGLDVETVGQHPVLGPGPHVVLRVEDTGEGMDAATVERIFEPFFTTKAPSQGTGLGLATVHGIVRQSGGHVSVRTGEGQGATFRVYLPRIAPPQPSSSREDDASPSAWKDAREPEAVAPPSSGTVLVVDDESLVRQTVANVLELAGFRVLAADGPGSVDVVLEGATTLDLLVTDVVMPGESGPELVERLRKRWSGLQVLFMSGYADELNTGRWRVELPYHYLQKPFSPGELLQIVFESMAARVPAHHGAGPREVGRREARARDVLSEGASSEGARVQGIEGSSPSEPGSADALGSAGEPGSADALGSADAQGSVGGLGPAGR